MSLIQEMSEHTRAERMRDSMKSNRDDSSEWKQSTQVNRISNSITKSPFTMSATQRVQRSPYIEMPLKQLISRASKVLNSSEKEAHAFRT